ncbi:hypothetical protein KsCSTR_12660 [Candidatus Kuenenia stuttgartiensis]|uniref:Uncharacterized protein n=1 Tax=Kuenenia stuttgartiensis TaxID=174633 RepID=Q1Q0F9_KUEST|nr:hypothetical protein KsCSTR_12660 [Candidatus Kuenenia stuttgartiensis]CAJ72007.1 unknown protein [Candidatus Kuenenia stuttgartiensis]
MCCNRNIFNSSSLCFLWLWWSCCFFRNGALLAKCCYIQSVLLCIILRRIFYGRGVNVRTHLSVKAEIFVS